MASPAPPHDPTSDGDLSAVLCPHCRYNLRGLSGNRCPECGQEFREEFAIHVGRRVSEGSVRLRQTAVLAMVAWFLFALAVLFANGKSDWACLYYLAIPGVSLMLAVHCIGTLLLVVIELREVRVHVPEPQRRLLRRWTLLAVLALCGPVVALLALWAMYVLG